MEKSEQKRLVASVAVDKCLYPFDHIYDYTVPAFLEGRLRVGQSVLVPFGRGNKKRIAMIYALEEKECDPERLKPIAGTSGNGVAMSAEQLGLTVWLKENTFCTYFDAIRVILPPGLTFGIREEYSFEDVSQSEYTKLTERERLLVDKLRTAKGSNRISGIIRDARMRPDGELAFTALSGRDVIKGLEVMKRRVGDETEQMVRLTEGWQEIPKAKALTPKQRKVTETVEEYESASVKELCYICSVTSAVIKNLVRIGILEEYAYTLSRAETSGYAKEKNPSDILLSEKQQHAFDTLSALMDGGKPSCALLHGVTGSGKTSVFIKLIDKAVGEGKTALMLVPEISLTPQMVGSFRSMFGNTVAIIHSSLSMGQRADEYKRIESGEARIVIGTRSAVFAPLDNIGVIVIDEEGEHTYKSDRSPRYHARNVAKQRAFFHGALLLLASATPSLDSSYNARTGKYTLVALDERFNRTELPEVYTIDMKAEYENGNRGNFSMALLHEIELNLRSGEQTLLLLNRRGYYTDLTCIKCGETMKCPNCDLPLTYHKPNDSLCCHYCGFTEPTPDKCPKCGGAYISQSGTGTQRIEDELKEYFPSARILRMDADTTMSKNAFSNRFAEFGRGEYDIMVGTQMIAKGLDFENVTLVGVLQIDKALYAGDYLGYERTFSLITQVVGRSGRGSKKGRAYLQTYSPDHYVLQLAARQDYDEFYAQEIEVRKALLFPPFCDICLIGFSSARSDFSERAAKRFLELFKERLAKENGSLPIRALGPTKMGTGMLAGRYRHKLVIKCRFNRQFRRVLSDTLAAAYKDSGFAFVSFYADINGEVV
ncbi:MAG: primosomal protein N' [Bacteroides sp.]|nr:primosomal protein N' [Bacteroides sp.]